MVESVTGAVTLACGLNCTQDYLRAINVLEYDQACLMEQMQKLKAAQQESLDMALYEERKMERVEEILGYRFECKAWLVDALTHKSFSSEQGKANNYERLEFLGDAVLGCLMARYFFLKTQEDATRKKPKELHKMKTSVINNALLSLIVIDNDIHDHVLFNHKAQSFKEQFEIYVKIVKENSQAVGSVFCLICVFLKCCSTSSVFNDYCIFISQWND